MNTTLEPQPRCAAPTALLAEDDEMIREIMSHYLQRLGYDVLEAENGQVAIDLLKQSPSVRLDLLVTDLLMPGASGEAVIRCARSLAACHRFLIVSGFANHTGCLDPDVREHSAYLEKPFTFSSFEAKLDELKQGVT